MHDIDNQISKLVGEDNYMDHLEKIIGNMLYIDTLQYDAKHLKISKCQSNIRVCLDKIMLYDNSIGDVLNEFKTNMLLFDTDHIYVVKTKVNKKTKVVKTTKLINPVYKPTYLYTTPWFSLIKRIEKTINNIFKQIFPDVTLEVDLENKRYVDVYDVFKSHPNLEDNYTIFNVRLVNKEIYESFRLIQRYCKIIVNMILNPWYDVKAKIESNKTVINKIFKMNINELNLQTTDDIVNILNNFVIAKYRSTLTGNNKHFVKIFMNVIGAGTVAEIDGSRFMEIVDSIDMSQLSNKVNAYKFATTAKSLMEQISKGETLTPDVMNKFDNLFVESDVSVDGVD